MRKRQNVRDLFAPSAVFVEFPLRMKRENHAIMWFINKSLTEDPYDFSKNVREHSVRLSDS